MISQKFSIFADRLSPDLREAIAASRRLQLRGVVLSAVGPSLDLTTLSSTGRREMRHLLHAENQTLVGVRVDLGTNGFAAGADIDRNLSRLDTILNVAADLNAEMIQIDLGSLPMSDESPRNVPKPISPELAGAIIIPSLAAPASLPVSTSNGRFVDQSALNQLDHALQALGAIADRYRMLVALSSALSEFAALERVIRIAACPWFGIDLDAVAVARDEWSLDEIFTNFATQIRHVRLHDAVVGKKSGSASRIKSAAIGDGSVEWPTLLSALDQSNFDGWKSFENASDVPRGLKMMKI